MLYNKVCSWFGLCHFLSLRLFHSRLIIHHCVTTYALVSVNSVIGSSTHNLSHLAFYYLWYIRPYQNFWLCTLKKLLANAFNDYLLCINVRKANITSTIKLHVYVSRWEHTVSRLLINNHFIEGLKSYVELNYHNHFNLSVIEYKTELKSKSVIFYVCFASTYNSY